MISTDSRKKLFDLLCRNSSPDFIEYLRAYEGLSRPPQEQFEVSCELVNGIRIDSMRLAVTFLRRKDVLRWFSACHRKIPLIQDLLFDNTTDECFGIGLADYPSGSGICRMKIYNDFGPTVSQARRVAHIQQLFSLLNIPDAAFRKDWERFKILDLLGIDWDRDGQAVIKVYFGPFHLGQLFGSLSDVLFKNEILYYDILRQNCLLPHAFFLVAKYSQDGRSQRTDLRLRTRKFAPYFKLFDHKREASKFFIDFYRIFPGMRLEFIGNQWAPSQKTQFYFMVGRYLGGVLCPNR
jgi:hypothetical protein